MSGRRQFVVLSCGLLLAGCGYRPLYGTTTESHGVVDSLASVAIPEAGTRLGQLIRNDLLSTMRPAGTAHEDRYTLTIEPTQTTSKVIDRSLPNATRSAVRVTVAFRLNEGSEILYSGKTFSNVSFDLVREPFADNQAEINATERAAREVSSDIRTRLAAFFAGR